ncbi:hypothetical protein AN958_01420 [Leucoagaricus sp. SymC.cos]|nr:hypothetical protein AN958_01420 [Leucoagaricus sp. SymC.cos]
MSLTERPLCSDSHSPTVLFVQLFQKLLNPQKEKPRQPPILTVEMVLDAHIDGNQDNYNMQGNPRDYEAFLAGSATAVNQNGYSQNVGTAGPQSPHQQNNQVIGSTNEPGVVGGLLSPTSPKQPHGLSHFSSVMSTEGSPSPPPLPPRPSAEELRRSMLLDAEVQLQIALYSSATPTERVEATSANQPSAPPPPPSLLASTFGPPSAALPTPSPHQNTSSERLNPLRSSILRTSTADNCALYPSYQTPSTQSLPSPPPSRAYDSTVANVPTSSPRPPVPPRPPQPHPRYTIATPSVSVGATAAPPPPPPPLPPLTPLSATSLSSQISGIQSPRRSFATHTKFPAIPEDETIGDDHDQRISGALRSTAVPWLEDSGLITQAPYDYSNVGRPPNSYPRHGPPQAAPPSRASTMPAPNAHHSLDSYTHQINTHSSMRRESYHMPWVWTL